MPSATPIHQEASSLSAMTSLTKRLGTATLVLFAFSFLLTTPAQGGPLTEFITNGGFETLSNGNTLGAAGGYFCQAGATCVSNVANWSSVCHAGASCGGGGTPDSILLANTNGSAFNGNIGLWALGQNGLGSTGVPNSPVGGNFVAFDGDPGFNASISQVVTGLTPGGRYTLTFWQGAAQQKNTDGATTEQWQVTFAGQTQTSTLINNDNHGWVPWQQQTLNFTAGSTGTETLSFLALGGPGGQPPVALLDGVSLQNAPEPQTYALVGLGLVAIPRLSRRWRQRRA